MGSLDFMGRQRPDGFWDVPRVPDNQLADLLDSMKHDVAAVWLRLRQDYDRMSGDVRRSCATHLEQIDADGCAKFIVGQVTKHRAHQMHGWTEHQFCEIGDEPRQVPLRTAVILLTHYNILIEECDAPGVADSPAPPEDEPAAPAAPTPKRSAPPKRARGKKA